LNAGGILGDMVGSGLVATFSHLGATLFLITLFLAGVTLFTSLSWLKLMDSTGRYTLDGFAWLTDLSYRLRDKLAGARARR